MITLYRTEHDSNGNNNKYHLCFPWSHILTYTWSQRLKRCSKPFQLVSFIFVCSKKCVLIPSLSHRLMTFYFSSVFCSIERSLKNFAM